MIVVLSDLHLGLPAAPTAAAVRPALEGATELVLNGDAAEDASPRWSGRARDELAGLREAAARAGAAVVRIEGNHDPGTGELIAMRAEGAVAITHGHAFHPAIAPWSHAAGEVSRAFAAAHAAGAAHAEPLRSLLAARAAARRERELDHARPPLAVLA